MINIVLYEPEIPPNTGNIMRLCANMGANLHLIKPYGFSLEEKKLRRAGLDYKDWAIVTEYENFESFFEINKPDILYAVSTKGVVHYAEITFTDGDYLLFGPESRGLPSNILSDLRLRAVIKIPMVEDSRSLNLSNAVAIIAYEFWRQLEYVGSSSS
ncbi:MAG: tRNA (uridine(34)/cytosine(34)/5-carboxymethylaminomethyluridine(34)-2'-O)-methyltransferase TrmL [Gammaproteobacteria bacterium]|nr:tRNA (uridine(34)/cytosine(34)/5-carboxymethylaminomethyluridine(34)-2'-O)-methyltransferase TrmL [Gammaproteobacteria bacterium]